MPITIPAPRPATASRPQAAAVAPVATGGARPSAARPRGNDLLFFTARLALLLDTGTSLNRALASLSVQQRDPVMLQLTQRVLADVEEGSSLSAALGRHPNAFDPVFVGMVRAGESAGILPAMLSRQADLLRRNRQFRAQLRSSLAYPCFLVVLSVVVSLFLLFVIYPRFASVFDNAQAALPPVTRALLALSLFARAHALWLPLAACAVVIGGRWGLRRPGFRVLVARTGFRAPAIGALLRHFHTTRLLLNLGTLLSSRVPLLDAITIAEGFVPRALYGEFFAELRQNVEAGRGVSPAFASCGLFPATVIEMIQTGESSSALDRIMLRLAEFYEDELQERLRVALQVLEPALLVVMGVVVAGISLSLLLPILKLSGSVR